MFTPRQELYCQGPVSKAQFRIWAQQILLTTHLEMNEKKIPNLAMPIALTPRDPLSLELRPKI